MNLEDMTPKQRMRLMKDLYLRAYRVHEATKNPKVKFVCKMIGCHSQGKYWCDQEGHPYKALTEIDTQLVHDEYDFLVLQGVLSP